VSDPVTLRYLTRFSCIGGECEDDCCHGWRVDIDEATYKKVKAAMLLSSDEARRPLKAAIRVVPAANKRERRRYQVRMGDEGRCPLQRPDGLCHVQAHFGEGMLSDVCATYPRRLIRVGKRLELTAMASCPEVSRQLLLHDDAVDEVPLDPQLMPRQALASVVETRDVRPFWRMTLEARGLVVDILRAREVALERRLLTVVWFAKRTSGVLNTDTLDGDLESVRREMRMARDPRVLDDIHARFDALETPSALVLLLARGLSNPGPAKGRESFRRLVDEVLGSYEGLRSALDDEAPQRLTVDAFWQAYLARRAAVLEAAPAAVDRVWTNYAINYWMQRPPMEAPDLLTYTLRFLTQMAIHRFLLYSHPALHQDGMTAEARREAFDAVAVDVVFRTARYVEHSGLLQVLERALAGRQLASMAGAVYLVRF
jgi:lysine-N-methylase